MNELIFRKKVPGGVEAIKAQLVAELQKEGFGILTEIDVSATLKTKMGVEIQPYHIYGACSPALAQQAIAAEADVGVIMPCNLVVRAQPNGEFEIIAVDPRKSGAQFNNPTLNPILEDAALRLARVVEGMK